MIERLIGVIHSLSLDDTCLKFVNTCVYSASD
jgi:hypothetical protein